MNCETTNWIYLIECQIFFCKKRYFGETKGEIRTRIAEHKWYINNHQHKATGEHFNSKGHTINDMRITEKVRYDDLPYRKERERDLIRIFDAFYNGLNRED